MFHSTEMPIKLMLSCLWFGPHMFLASLACDAINQVGILASDVLARKSTASNSIQVNLYAGVKLRGKSGIVYLCRSFLN